MARSFSAPTLSWTMNQAQLARFRTRVEQFRGLPLQQRLAKGTLKAADYMVNPMRAAAPVAQAGVPGRGYLRRSVRARPATISVFGLIGKTLGAWVGPTAPHRALVIRGHEIVTPYLHRDLGRRTRANPFVDAVARAHKSEAIRIVRDILFRR